MRIGALSQATDVPISTLKYYIREGLLPPGTPTATNQAEYGDAHLERVRLIRALVEVGGLSASEVAPVLAAVDDPSVPLFNALVVSQEALLRDSVRKAPGAESATMVKAREWVDAFIERQGFAVRADAGVRDALAATLVRMSEFGLADLNSSDPATDAYFDRIAAFARELAATEGEMLRDDVSRADMVSTVLVGTVLTDTVVSLIRRLADEDASSGQLGNA